MDGEASLADIVPWEHVSYRVDADSLELHYEATVTLTPVGDKETELDDRGHHGGKVAEMTGTEAAPWRW